MTDSVDFPTMPGAFDTTFNDEPGTGPADGFVTKLAPNGSTLSYSSFLGGIGNDFGRGIAVDGAGSAYVTGETSAADFPTTPDAFDTTFNGELDEADVFVTKLAVDGSELAYSTFLGGSEAHDIGRDVAVDAAGSAYVTGETLAADFPITPGAFDSSLGGFGDAFVTKIVPDGSRLAYSTYLGGRAAMTAAPAWRSTVPAAAM